MIYGQQQEAPAVARVREFAKAVRAGLAGQAPGVQTPEDQHRAAGVAAAPLLTPPGAGVEAPGPQGPTFGPAMIALARQRRQQGDQMRAPRASFRRPGGWREGREPMKGADPGMGSPGRRRVVAY